jgi:hypothetical protein
MVAWVGVWESDCSVHRMISLIPFSQRSNWYFCVLMAGRPVGDDYVREKRRLV